MSQGNTKYFQPTAMQPHPYEILASRLIRQILTI